MSEYYSIQFKKRSILRRLRDGVGDATVLERELAENRLLGDSFAVELAQPEPLAAMLLTKSSKKSSSKQRLRVDVTDQGSVCLCSCAVVDPASASASAPSSSYWKLSESPDGSFECRSCARPVSVDEICSVEAARGEDNVAVLLLDLSRGAPKKTKKKKKPPSTRNLPMKLHFSTVVDRDEFVYTLQAALRLYEVSRVRILDGMASISELRRTAFDGSRHTPVLLGLWTSLFGGDCSEAPGLPDERWSSIGFQGKDPRTDLRSMGVLPLYCLHYFFSKYKNGVLRVYRDLDYPLACSGISVCHYLLDVLGVDRPAAAADSDALLFLIACACSSSHHANAGDAPSAEQLIIQPFLELFVSTMILLNAVFLAQKASYMDFPRVFEQTKADLGAILDRRPKSVAEFCQNIDLLLMTNHESSVDWFHL